MGFRYTDAAFGITATELHAEDEDGYMVSLPYTGIDHAVLLALAQRANNETGICWAGFGRISSDTHFSRKSVMRSVAKLEQFGFLTIEEPTEDRSCNTYRLQLDKLVAASTIPARRKPNIKRVTRTVGIPKEPIQWLEDDDDELA